MAHQDIAEARQVKGIRDRAGPTSVGRALSYSPLLPCKNLDLVLPNLPVLFFDCFHFFSRSLKSRFFSVLVPNILKSHAKQNMYAERIGPLGYHLATSDPVKWFFTLFFFFFSHRRFSLNKSFCGTAINDINPSRALVRPGQRHSLSFQPQAVLVAAPE